MRLTSTPRTPVSYPGLPRAIPWPIALRNLDFRAGMDIAQNGRYPIAFIPCSTAQYIAAVEYNTGVSHPHHKARRRVSASPATGVLVTGGF